MCSYQFQVGTDFAWLPTLLREILAKPPEIMKNLFKPGLYSPEKYLLMKMGDKEILQVISCLYLSDPCIHNLS